MIGKHSRYSLASTQFAFRALAALTGRTQTHGDRELVMATLVCARLASNAIGASRLMTRSREMRADQTQRWLATLAVPAPARVAFQRLVEATGTDDVESIAVNLSHVLELVDELLDSASRLELGRLVHRVSTERSEELLRRGGPVAADAAGG